VKWNVLFQQLLFGEMERVVPTTTFR